MCVFPASQDAPQSVPGHTGSIAALRRVPFSKDFSLPVGRGDPARSHACCMRRTLLRRLPDEVLTSRERELVFRRLGIGEPKEEAATFVDLAVQLQYDSPNDARKAYKNAIRKLRDGLYMGAYGQWQAILQALRQAEAEVAGIYDCTVPQTACGSPGLFPSDVPQRAECASPYREDSLIIISMAKGKCPYWI